MSEKIKVAYLIGDYPQISQTYIHEEISSLRSEYEIKIFTWMKPDLARSHYHPYEFSHNASELMQKLVAFRPQVLHTHYFNNIQMMESFATQLSIPYTLRTHSFDIWKPKSEKLAKYCHMAKSRWCLRVLCFPEFKEKLIAHGMPEEKVVSTWPVVNYQHFYNPSKPDSQRRIMNVGAALDKKNYPGFIDLASLMQPEGYEFNLYIMGYETEKLIQYNESKGHPVKEITHADYEEMPKIYRAHEWLVYTADPEINTLGLPMAIAEAQASGIGVCLQEMPGRRGPLLDYLGGAGFLFKTIDELPEILRQPYPEDMRLRGLENAKKCDISAHKVLLSEVWDKVR